MAVTAMDGVAAAAAGVAAAAEVTAGVAVAAGKAAAEAAEGMAAAEVVVMEEEMAVEQRTVMEKVAAAAVENAVEAMELDMATTVEAAILLAGATDEPIHVEIKNLS